MAKLLILGPSFRRNSNPELIPAIERYDGLYYRIVRKYMNKLKKKDIDVIIITEDLNVLFPETKIPYKPPVGEKWRTLPPTSRDPEKIEKLRNQILKIVIRRDIHSPKQVLSGTTIECNTKHREDNIRL